MLQTWVDLHYACVAAALAFTVCYSQREAVLPCHQVAKEQYCLVVRVIQDILPKINQTKNKWDSWGCFVNIKFSVFFYCALQF